MRVHGTNLAQAEGTLKGSNRGSNAVRLRRSTAFDSVEASRYVVENRHARKQWTPILPTCNQQATSSILVPGSIPTLPVCARAKNVQCPITKES